MRLSFATVLRACLLAGLLAGACAAVVGLAVVQPAMAPALEIEQARAAAEPHHHADAAGAAEPHTGAAAVPRAVQVAGGVVVAVVAGAVLGSLFAVAFALLRPRLPARTDFGRAVVLAAVGWAVLALLPAVKIPANPPAVGDPATAGLRSAIYVGVLVAGMCTAVAGWGAHRWLAARGTDLPARSAGTAAVVVALVAATLVLLPWSPDAVPPDVPAAVVWNFRLASLAELTTLWAVLGLSAGWLLHRAAGRPRRAAGQAPVEAPA